MKRLIPLAALLAATACYVDATDCTPTRMSARAADKVSLNRPTGSAVVTATLTADGEPLAGREVDFAILDDDAAVYRDETTSGSNGAAQVDLKRADADALLALARADAFRASFGGDGTYCASSDDAAFRTVRG